MWSFQLRYQDALYLLYYQWDEGVDNMQCTWSWIRINSDVTLTAHVAATVAAGFSILRQIGSVRLSLFRDPLIVPIRAFIIS